MFTTGSKLLIGATVLATISAIAYGVTQEGVMGTVGLVSAAVALGFLAGVNIYVRDANVWADEISTVESTSAAARPPADSIWPMAFALGAVVLTVGLVTYQAVFIVGVVLLLAAGAEWTAEAWAERASADEAYNAQVRSRIANPLEFPLEGVGDAAAHLRVVRLVGRGPFGPRFGRPFGTGGQEQHHADDEHRLVGDEADGEHHGAEGEGHRPDAVGRWARGGRRGLDGGDLVGPDVGVAHVDVDAGEEAERHGRRNEADGSHHPFLGHAVGDGRDGGENGGADEEF